jgi:hypothetical protein
MKLKKFINKKYLKINLKLKYKLKLLKIKKENIVNLLERPYIQIYLKIQMIIHFGYLKVNMKKWEIELYIN